MAHHHDGMTGHGNPWRTGEHARAWIERTEGGGRDRTGEIETFAALVPFATDASARVLELGAGTGALTSVFLERFPRARVLALDLSEVMIDEGRARLRRFGDRVRFQQWDMEEEGWPPEASGPFDLVASSIAIHHLAAERKRGLVRQVFACLRPGGSFMNLDYVAPASDALAARYAQALERLSGGAADEGHQCAAGGHASGTLSDYLEDLRLAGFVDVDVFWKVLGVAITGGTRP